ncbi:TMC family-containing protein [Aphelenchoides bicaudatus]|nr:TMC family-containing protein [Aphelenchoides bicaudatus]
MASNARNSKLQDGRTEQYVFSWKVINGWDYSLGNPETAQSLFKANVTKLKESIGEFNVKMKQKMNCMIITRRIFVNIIITAMIVFTAWIIWKASYLDKDTFLKQNAVSIIVSFVTLVFPNLFELIGHLECFHPRFALRVHLARVFVLYVVAYYTLFASLFAMLNSLQTQTVTEVTTADAYTYNQPFSIVFNPNARSNKTYYETVTQRKRYRSRHFRQLAENDTNALDPPPAFTKPPIFTYTTTPAPQPLWTTVQSNFGPFGVGILQPKVLVLPDKKLQKHKTVYETRPIGPLGDWNDATTQGPIPLHYTTSPRRALIKSSRGFYTGDSVCWETTIGQEIVKVVVTDLVLTVFIIMVIDFLRDLWVRYCVLFWCWNLEEGFPGYGEFKISENVLHLIKDQTMVWLGTMFVPLLPVINIIKLVVLMYLRGWAVMSCNVPARQIFRASRSNNFYLILLLVMFLVSTVPLGYVIASIPPSKGCGPFAGQPHFYSILLSSLRENLNQNVVSFLESILSPGFIIPVLLLLMLVIYFMFALIRGLREANSELSEQLTHERTEERYRVYNLAKGADSKTANGLGRTGKHSPEKMGSKIIAAALRTPSHRSPQRSLKSPTSLDEFSSIHSPSKSPISPRIAAHASFLPSLQSLKEDASVEEEAEDEQSEETEQKQHLLQKPRGSSILPPPEAFVKDVRYDDLPPVKLNWKQKFMVLIGLQDRDKLEAKLRMRQLAETAYAGDQEEPENEKDNEDNKQYSGSDHSSDNKTQSEKSSIILPPTTPQVRNSLLEEASSSTNNDYSDQPQAMQRGLRPRIPTPATVIGSPKGRTPSHSPWSRAGSSRGTGGTDEDTGGEPTTIINTGQPAQPQHQRAQSQRRTGLSADRTTPKHLGSPWLLEPEVPARRAFSMNDPKRLQAPFERDLASEASPLMEKSSDEIMEEYKLSPQKRSPPSGPHRKRSSGSNIREYSLDPTPMIYQDQPAKPIPSVEGSYWDHAQKMHVSDDPTRPPSEDASFRDPTPTFGDEHRLRSPLLDMPDDRLSYANPYSSYAAAMCSPVMQQNMANDPLVQRLSQPLPELSVTPEPQQMYPIQPTNFYGTPPLGQYPLQIPQPYYAQQSPAAFTPVRARQSTVPRQSSAQPAYYYQQPMTPPSIPQRFFPPPIGENYPMYDHTFSPYHSTRTAPSTPRQLTSPLYQQYYPPMSAGYNTEPRHLPLRADPRNISPPSGGYITGSTNSPTPELAKPRFRISSSPPRRGKPNYASDSGQGSSDPSVRRWDLRQRGELVSTDSSSPERKSPNRGYSQQQTTV